MNHTTFILSAYTIIVTETKYVEAPNKNHKQFTPPPPLVIPLVSGEQWNYFKGNTGESPQKCPAWTGSPPKYIFHLHWNCNELWHWPPKLTPFWLGLLQAGAICACLSLLLLASLQLPHPLHHLTHCLPCHVLHYLPSQLRLHLQKSTSLFTCGFFSCLSFMVSAVTGLAICCAVGNTVHKRFFLCMKITIQMLCLKYLLFFIFQNSL